MNVALTPELEKFVEEKVRSGGYGSAEEVVAGALEIMKEFESGAEDLSHLRDQVEVGARQLERGEYSTYESADEFMDEIEAEVQATLKTRAKLAA